MSSILPQSGFGSIQEFIALRDRGHHLLFRVYTPKDLQRNAQSDSDIFFIAPKFDSVYTNASESLPSHPLDPTYHDVVHHLEWSTRSSSPFISASFSFSWALWQACVRYQAHIKHDVEIAVIDAGAVQAFTAAEIMSQCKQESRHPNHWKWYHSMQQAQTVLISDVVHKQGVLASFPIVKLLDSLPSYFVSCEREKRSCLSLAASRSFSSFSREVTARFLRQDDKTRLHSATTGSIALSWKFLRTWISTTSQDKDRSLETLSRLALQIAHWPAQFWTTEHTEVEQIINDVSQILVDTILSQRKEYDVLNKHVEAVVQDLEHILDSYTQDLQTYAESSGFASDGNTSEPMDMSIDEAPSMDEAPSAPMVESKRVSTATGHLPSQESEIIVSFPRPALQSCRSFADLRARSIPTKSPSVMEQASFATVFFLFSALTTFLVAHTNSQPSFLPNIT